MGVSHLIPPLVLTNAPQQPDPNNPCAGGARCYTDSYGEWNCSTGEPCSVPDPPCPSPRQLLIDRGYIFDTPKPQQRCWEESDYQKKRMVDGTYEATARKNTITYGKYKITPQWYWQNETSFMTGGGGNGQSQGNNVPVIHDGKEYYVTQKIREVAEFFRDKQSIPQTVIDNFKVKGIVYEDNDCIEDIKDTYTRTVQKPDGSWDTQNLTKAEAEALYEDVAAGSNRNVTEIEYQENEWSSALSNIARANIPLGNSNFSLNIGAGFGTANVSTGGGINISQNWASESSNTQEFSAPTPAPRGRGTRGSSQPQPSGSGGDNTLGGDRTKGTTHRNKNPKVTRTRIYITPKVGLEYQWNGNPDYTYNFDVNINDITEHDFDQTSFCISAQFNF